MDDKLKIIALQNFQNHSQTILKLHPGVNVIIGASDEGKTAIMRCVDWIRTNRPSGSGFMKWGAKYPTKGVLQFADGQVTRIKSKGLNQYKFSPYEEPFSALGADVPAEISSFLNMTEINVQGQFDKFFMLQETSGKVSNKLNEVAGLDEIDIIMAMVNKEVKDSKALVGILEKDIKEKNEELKQYENLEEIEKIIAEASSISDTIERLGLKIVGLDKLLKFINDADKRMKEYSYLDDLDAEVQQLHKLSEEVQYYISAESHLTSLLERLNSIDTDLQNTEEWLEIEPDLISLEKLHKGLQEAQEEEKKLVSLLDGLQKISSQELTASQDLQKFEDDLRNRMIEIKMCPLCGVEYK